MYVQRDSEGQIYALSQHKSAEFNEWQPLYSDEVQCFLNQSEETPEEAKALWQSSDVAFIRVLEDLIELLTIKGLIKFTELPEQVQEKLIARKSVRDKAHKLVLFDEDNKKSEIKLPD